MFQTDPVARIDALTRNARTTWFTLLGVTLFVGLTLMGVEHIDFYGVDRATQLPLVNVAVPTTLFFYAAPVLTAAVYAYFHLYLLRLWDALSVADAEVSGQTLGDAIAPWLMSDGALFLRKLRRAEDQKPTTHRMLEGTAMVLNFGVAWLFGLVVLGFLWTQSMAARDVWMTSIAGASLVGSAFTGTASLVMLFRRMRVRGTETDGNVFKTIPSMLLYAVILPMVLLLGFVRTVELPEWVRTTAEGADLSLAPIDMAGEAIVERPPGWVPHALAKTDFYATWCRREELTCKIDSLDDLARVRFEEEWQERRSIVLVDLRKPAWSSRDRAPNFQGALLSDSFMAGANLRSADLRGTIMTKTELEGADLSYAEMDRAVLVDAKMQAADLNNAHLPSAILIRTRLETANLAATQLPGANMSAIQLRWVVASNINLTGAFLPSAQITASDLRDAEMTSAVLEGATIDGSDLARADLRMAQIAHAHLEDTSLAFADLSGASLRSARLIGVTLQDTRLLNVEMSYAWLDGNAVSYRPDATRLSGDKFGGMALRNVDLGAVQIATGTDLRNAFLDGTVKYTLEQARFFGDQCQSPKTAVGYQEFVARWRGWIEHASNPDEARGRVWRNLAPQGYEDVTPVPPPAGCAWKTAPLRSASAPSE